MSYCHAGSSGGDADMQDGGVQQVLQVQQDATSTRSTEALRQRTILGVQPDNSEGRDVPLRDHPLRSAILPPEAQSGPSTT
jgi:hypothetical protein